MRRTDHHQAAKGAGQGKHQQHGGDLCLRAVLVGGDEADITIPEEMDHHCQG